MECGYNSWHIFYFIYAYFFFSAPLKKPTLCSSGDDKSNDNQHFTFMMYDLNLLNFINVRNAFDFCRNLCPFCVSLLPSITRGLSHHTLFPHTWLNDFFIVHTMHNIYTEFGIQCYFFFVRSSFFSHATRRFPLSLSAQGTIVFYDIIFIFILFYNILLLFLSFNLIHQTLQLLNT